MSKYRAGSILWQYRRKKQILSKSVLLSMLPTTEEQ